VRPFKFKRTCAWPSPARSRLSLSALECKITCSFIELERLDCVREVEVPLGEWVRPGSLERRGANHRRGGDFEAWRSSKVRTRSRSSRFSEDLVVGGPPRFNEVKMDVFFRYYEIQNDHSWRSASKSSCLHFLRHHWRRLPLPLSALSLDVAERRVVGDCSVLTRRD